MPLKKKRSCKKRRKSGMSRYRKTNLSTYRKNRARSYKRKKGAKDIIKAILKKVGNWIRGTKGEGVGYDTIYA